MTSRVSRVDERYSGLGANDAESRLCARIMFYIQVQRRLQPDLTEETLRRAVDEALIDYVSAGHPRTAKIESVVSQAMTEFSESNREIVA